MDDDDDDGENNNNNSSSSNKNNNNSIQFKQVLHYLRVGTTAVRPNRDTAQQHKINTNIQETSGNSCKRGNKSHS